MDLEVSDSVDLSLFRPSERALSYPARVKEIRDRSVVLVLLPPSQLPVAAGSMVNIKKTAQGQVFIFEAVVSQIHSAPLTLDVAITTHSKRAQRRSSPRFPVYQEIRYRRAGNEEGWLPARIWDLSAEGICIISAQKHEPEDKIIIEFTAVQKIYLVGVVRVCTAHKTGADAFALGVQFANLGNEKQKAIGRFLLENQIEKVRTAGSLLYHYTPRKPIIIPGRKSAPPA